MERREFEVGNFGGRRWLVEVQPGVVRVRVPVPATFPACPVLVLFDVVDREIASREPSDVETGRSYCVRISSSVEQPTKQSRFVCIRVERGLGDE
jgi:hypothetical protein